MESWRMVWRRGVEPLLSTVSLEALRQALASDDRRLLQGRTSEPPTLQCVQDWPVEAACLLGFCGLADGLTTVAEIEEFFARVCFEASEAVGEAASCRYLLNWWDRTPRDEARREMLIEVNRSLARRLAADEKGNP